MNVLKIKRRNLYIIVTILMMIFAAMTNAATYLMLVIISVMFFYVNWNSVNGNDILIPKMAISLLLFQNFAIGIGAHMTGNFSSGLSWLTQIPTIFIAMAYLSIVLKKHIHKSELVFFIYLLFCLVFFFMGNGGVVAKVTYFRNFTIFFMAFRIGKHYINTRDRFLQFIDFFMKLSIIAVVFGLIGWFIGKSFYQSIGVLEVYKAKQYTAYRDGLPGNFRTLFFGNWVDRFASLYYDPVNFSYYMALACLIAFMSRRKALFIIFVICEMLTFGKGGLLILGLSLMCVLVQKLFSRYNAKLTRSLIIIMAIVAMAALVYIIQTKYANDFGTYNHFYGMITGINGVIRNPLGHGLGSAGNLIKTVEINSQEVSETGMINLAYQIGVLGVALFSYLFLSTAHGAFLNYKKDKEQLCLLCSFLPFVLLVVSIFQENTYTPQCVVPYMLLIGGACNANIIAERNVKRKWKS